MKKSELLMILSFSLLLAACGGGEMSDDEYAERMAREHQEDSPVPGAAGSAELVEVAGESVGYAAVDGTTVNGYLALPSEEALGVPGIIVIHEWWGLNRNMRTMADRLASEGYAALAVDLYGGEVAEAPERARELMQRAMQDPAEAEENLRQAYTYLEERLQAPRIGVIGWCFGGGWSLQTALLMPEKIDAAVIYYGRLVTDPEQLDKLEMPILGIFGAEDEGIPVESVREFQSQLQELGKDATIEIYEGADHAFANPSGERFQAAAAADAWKNTVEFLAEHLKQ